MKKLLFVLLALAIATPAMAMTVTAVDQGGGVVAINYTMANAEKRVRAFGLDVSIAAPATIDTIDNYITTGVSTAAARGYGIFPSNIAIDTAGNFTSSGSPVSTKPGTNALGGLTTQGVTLELGSLYAPTTSDANAPLLNTGGTITLCKLHCTAHGAGSAALTIAVNSTRGGIVYEDGTTEASPTLTGTTVTFAVPPAIPTGVAATKGAFVNKITVTWPAVSGATSYDVYRNTANNTTSGTLALQGNVTTTSRDDTTGTSFTNYYYFVIAKNSAGNSGYSTGAQGYCLSAGTACLTVGQVFTRSGTTNLTVATQHTSRWAALGNPKCWCCPSQKIGNGNVMSSVSKIDAADLADVKLAWFKIIGQVGYLPCADADMSNKVDAADLALVKNHWFQTPIGTDCK